MIGLTIALITAACIFGGMPIGLAFRRFVPDQHLQPDSKDAALYLSFGLLAPPNVTVLSMMFFGAVVLATALFLITEMNHPMTDAIKVFSDPMRKALEHIGK